MAKRYAEADGLRQRFDGCKSMAGLAKDASTATFEDMKYIVPSSIPETHALDVAQRQGRRRAAAATAAAGIEIYGRLRTALDQDR